MVIIFRRFRQTIMSVILLKFGESTVFVHVDPDGRLNTLGRFYGVRVKVKVFPNILISVCI
jgi:hypothetical protein